MSSTLPGESVNAGLFDAESRRSLASIKSKGNGPWANIACIQAVAGPRAAGGNISEIHVEIGLGGHAARKSVLEPTKCF